MDFFFTEQGLAYVIWKTTYKPRLVFEAGWNYHEPGEGRRRSWLLAHSKGIQPQG